MGGYFPRLNDSDFPHISNVDVYKYRNKFDYNRYDSVQMQCTICNVPWDMGEAHIGNRTISGIGNVVYFGEKESRDEWFSAIPDDECVRFSTKYRDLHTKLYMDIELPFDVAARYNYLVVHHSELAADGSPVMGENDNGIRKWFWFIRDVEFVAPNTTRINLLLDAWQTFIYDLDVSGMILERGHAPLFEIGAAEYLENPIGKCAGLLADDLEVAEPRITAHTASCVFNTGDMYALIICNSAPWGSWGSKAGNSWNVPSGYSQVNGTVGYYAFVMNANSFHGFWNNMIEDVPQFVQTVKCVAFVAKDLVTISQKFTFCNTTCYHVESDYVSKPLYKLDIDDFGYADEYKDLAKLYTYPYAVLSLTDENGDEVQIRIEDTTGELKVNACVNLAFPFLGIDSHVSGIGSGSGTNVNFRAIDPREFPISGNWHDTLREMDIPTFAIIQRPSIRNDYSTHFDRAQQATAAQNAYDSSVAAADTGLADTNAVADTQVANAGLQQTANSAITAAGNTQANADTAQSNTTNGSTASAANAYTGASTNNAINLEYANASVSQAANVATTASSVIASAATANIGGAVSALVGGVVNAATTQASVDAGVNYRATAAYESAVYNAQKALIAARDALGHNDNAITAANAKNSATNAMIGGTAANSAATTKANAQRDRNTSVANAGRTRSTATSAISNSIKQAALGVPFEGGTMGNLQHVHTRPQGWFCNVVTQNPGIVRQIGDMFLRYGYAYNKVWDFDGDWNIGPKFTYWKLVDFWVSGLSIPDKYVDQLRFFLYGGVTVWRKPEYIGHTSIYENK